MSELHHLLLAPQVFNQSQVSSYTTIPTSASGKSTVLAGTVHHQLISSLVRLKFLPLHYHLHNLFRFLTKVHFWQVLYTTISASFSAPLLESNYGRYCCHSVSSSCNHTVTLPAPPLLELRSYNHTPSPSAPQVPLVKVKFQQLHRHHLHKHISPGPVLANTVLYHLYHLLSLPVRVTYVPVTTLSSFFSPWSESSSYKHTSISASLVARSGNRRLDL